MTNSSDCAYKRFLDRDFIVFVINKWLYVISYNHINDSRNDNDYNPTRNKVLRDLYKQGLTTQRFLYIYCKYVGDTNQNKWKMANNNAILSHAIAYPITSNSSSFNPHYKDIKYSERVLRLKDNTIFLLCGIKNIDYNGGSDMDDYVDYQKLLILSPEETYSDGSIYFDSNIYFHQDSYIKKLNKINYYGTSTIVEAIDSNQKPCTIEKLASGKFSIKGSWGEKY
jgi:hypothetical protein